MYHVSQDERQERKPFTMALRQCFGVMRCLAKSGARRTRRNGALLSGTCSFGCIHVSPCVVHALNFIFRWEQVGDECRSIGTEADAT